MAKAIPNDVLNSLYKVTDPQQALNYIQTLQKGGYDVQSLSSSPWLKNLTGTRSNYQAEPTTTPKISGGSMDSPTSVNSMNNGREFGSDVERKGTGAQSYMDNRNREIADAVKKAGLSDSTADLQNYLRQYSSFANATPEQQTNTIVAIQSLLQNQQQSQYDTQNKTTQNDIIADVAGGNEKLEDKFNAHNSVTDSKYKEKEDAYNNYVNDLNNNYTDVEQQMTDSQRSQLARLEQREKEYLSNYAKLLGHNTELYDAAMKDIQVRAGGYATRLLSGAGADGLTTNATSEALQMGMNQFAGVIAQEKQRNLDYLTGLSKEYDNFLKDIYTTAESLGDRGIEFAEKIAARRDAIAKERLQLENTKIEELYAPMQEYLKKYLEGAGEQSTADGKLDAKTSTYTQADIATRKQMLINNAIQAGIENIQTLPAGALDTAANMSNFADAIEYLSQQAKAKPVTTSSKSINTNTGTEVENNGTTTNNNTGTTGGVIFDNALSKIDAINSYLDDGNTSTSRPSLEDLYNERPSLEDLYNN